MDHSDSDCLVVALLSHGNDGSVYAYDAAFPTQVNRRNINWKIFNPGLFQRLWEPFVGDKAPTLVGKPKLFFIQVSNKDIEETNSRAQRHSRFRPVRGP